jgi:hypothetical protein
MYLRLWKGWERLRFKVLVIAVAVVLGIYKYRFNYALSKKG